MKESVTASGQDLNSAWAPESQLCQFYSIHSHSVKQRVAPRSLDKLNIVR
jgi:hypothetical protein